MARHSDIRQLAINSVRDLALPLLAFGAMVSASQIVHAQSEVVPAGEVKVASGEAPTVSLPQSVENWLT